MKIVDGHCDVLYKMWVDKNQQFYSNSGLDVTYNCLVNANVLLQTFAIFIPPSISHGQKLKEALKQVDLFYTHILQDEERVFLIKNKIDLEKCNKKIGAILHIEGADSLEGELCNLRILFNLGLRQLGLTWNNANDAADGIKESRGGGLSSFGKRLVKEMNNLGIILDVSHLSVQGFWDVVKEEIPLIASHSNAYKVCSNDRNLSDEQIKEIINRGGLIGITFVPSFVSSNTPTIDDLLLHIDHILSLGGENTIYIGSDFDGTEEKIPNLKNACDFKNFLKVLNSRYSEELVHKVTWKNAYNFYEKNLR